MCGHHFIARGLAGAALCACSAVMAAESSQGAASPPPPATAPAQQGKEGGLRNDAISDANLNAGRLRGDSNFANGIRAMSESKDYEKAFGFFKVSADEGYCQAFGYAGQFLLEGLGVAPDPNVAVTYFSKGSECGDVQSYFGLGMCYEHGRGVDKNIDNAIYWYDKAIERNYAPAMYSEGILLIKSNRDTERVNVLMESAARLRYAPAVEFYYKHIIGTPR